MVMVFLKCLKKNHHHLNIMISKSVLSLLFFIIGSSTAQLLLNGKLSKIDSPLASRVQKREHLRFNLEYEQDTYFATTLSIGNPPQNITVLFDTGSADTWLMDSKNPFCQANFESDANHESLTYNNVPIKGRSIDCSAIRMFNSDQSSSLTLDDKRFYIQYEDKTFADGSWAKETFNINGVPIRDVTFGLAEYATTPLGGVLGIGFERRESISGYENAPNKYYDNFPQILKNEKIIDSVAYSLSLKDDNSSILFGAVDKNGYKGNLVTFPMINMYPTAVSKPATLSLTIQGVGAKQYSKCDFETLMSIKYPVLLDSGSTLISAPVLIADKMAAYVGATWSDVDGIYVFNCPDSEKASDTVFTFDFGDISIDIKLTDLTLSSQDDSNTCAFAILRGNNEFVLGDSFLKSTYVVYDLDNYFISMGKINDDTNVQNEHFINIPKNGHIPGAKMATAEPWKSYDQFTVTSDMYASSKTECGLNKPTPTKLSSINSEAIHKKPMHLVTKVETVSKTIYSTVKVCHSDEMGK